VLGARSVSLFNGLGSSCRTSCNPGPAAATEALSLVAIGAGVAGVAVGSWLVVSPVPAVAPRSSRVVVAPRVTARSEELTLTGTW
jgi:hypothetical protein